MPNANLPERVPAPNPRFQEGCWHKLLGGGHPRLLGPAEHLKDLASRKPDIFKELHFSEKDSALDSGGLHKLLAQAIVQAVEGLPAVAVKKNLEAVLSLTAGPATNIHQDTWIAMQRAAFCYDFYHAQLSAEERRQICAWLNAHLSVYTDDENAFHNSILSKLLVYLQAAYATWNENPQARAFRDYAILKLYEGLVAPVLNAFGQGGGFTECGWYCRHSLVHLAQALELARRMEGYDGFQLAPRFFYHRLAYELLHPYPAGMPGQDAPSQNYSCEGDGNKMYSPFMEYPRILRILLAQYFSGSELARYTHSLRRRGSSPFVRVFDFLYEEDAEEAKNCRDFPMAHLALGIGKLFARGDWSEDASWLRFECGPFWTQHQHFEAGNFEIFRRAPLASDSGEYVGWSTPHAVNWLVRTIAHNCVLIHKPDEQWRYSRNASGAPMANDGGQGYNTYIVHNLPDWQARREDFERGKIITCHNQPEFMVVTGDATKAYHPHKAACVKRTIVFLRPHCFVVVDRVASTSREYAKTWVLHCHAEPTLEGRCFTIAHKGGALHGQTLWPMAAEAEKIHGYAYGGQTFTPESNCYAQVADLWRIEVRPLEKAAETLFVHVLSTDGPVSAKAETADGSVCVKAPGWEVRWEEAEGGIVTLKGKRYRIAGGIKLGAYET